MNDKQKETYVAWLNDAHAMEEALVTVLEKQIKDSEGHPEIVNRLKEHLEETKRHAEMVGAAVKRHGEDTSGGKDVLGRMTAAINGFGMSMMDDLEVKNAHSSYAAEHFEIATYQTIRAAAEILGDTEAVTMCNTILADEEKMAKWLMEHLPGVTKEYLNKLQ